MRGDFGTDMNADSTTATTDSTTGSNAGVQPDAARVPAATPRATVVTVTPNPALDQTVRVANLTLGDVNRAESLEFNAGGKGVNVAGCLADYGIDTIATGLLGAQDSAVFDAMFADKGIADCFVRIAGRTRINVKLVDPARDETTDVNLATSRPTSGDVAALERRLAELAAPGRWFVLAGSLPLGVDASFYRRATRMLHDAGARVALDTSGAPLADALAAADPRELPDLVKPNLAELEAALGRTLGDDDGAIARAACELVARGIGYVAVSLGARGALGVTASGEAEKAGAAAAWHAQAPLDARAASSAAQASLPAPVAAAAGQTVASTATAVAAAAATAADSAAASPPRRAAPVTFECFRATPPRVRVASTVGAGDAFVAGLVASLTEARTWCDAGRRASAFAAAKLARVGPHLPDRATLDALSAQVEVERFTLTASADGVVVDL